MSRKVKVFVGSVGRNGADRPRKVALSLREVWSRLARMPGTVFSFSGGFLSVKDSILYATSEGVGPETETVRVVGSVAGSGRSLSLVVELIDTPREYYFVNWQYHGVRNFKCDTILSPSTAKESNIRDTQTMRGTKGLLSKLRKSVRNKGGPIETI